MSRLLSAEDILKKKYNKLIFDGKWYESFGNPERSSSWIVWGLSGNGKTRFSLELAKYISKFGKVLYNSIEEDTGLTMQMALEACNMTDIGKNVKFPKEGQFIEGFSKILDKKRSPNIVFIDSLQYFGFKDKYDYINFVKRYPRKLFIFISHADGKLPKGALGGAVHYHSNVKIRVDRFKAIIDNRYGKDKSFVIWEEGAAKHHGEVNFN